MDKIAVIDLGSNSIRMSIFGVLKNGKIRTLKNYRDMVMLSEGMGDEKLLCEKAMQRTIKAITEYKKVIDEEKIETVLAVATAAVRKAANGASFVAEVFEKTKINIEVINGEKEAYYDFLAVKLLGIEKGIICDIGGGSTELIDVSGDVCSERRISIPIGSRLICEKFFRGGETDLAIRQAQEFFNREIEKIGWLSEMENAQIIGIGGSLRAIAKFDMQDNSKKAISMHKIEAKRLDEICETISKASVQEREGFIGIGKERADIIMGGIVPLACIRNKINSPAIIVADIGVREGVLLDFLKNNA